jgi:hypothetical protein
MRSEKWDTIEYKRTLSDCAVDGVLPERGLVTPEQAHKEAVRWLERLARGVLNPKIKDVRLLNTKVYVRPLKVILQYVKI